MILTLLCCESFYLYQQDKNEWNVEKEPSYVTGATLNSYELKKCGTFAHKKRLPCDGKKYRKRRHVD